MKDFIVILALIVAFSVVNVESVVGGKQAKKGEIPQVAAIVNVELLAKHPNGISGEGVCQTATIIDNMFIITKYEHIEHINANNSQNYEVFLGAFDLYDKNLIKRKIAKITPHKSYIKGQILNNLALIRLNEKFEETDFAKAINSRIIPNDYYPNVGGTVYTAAGFGLTQVRRFRSI